MIKKFNSLAVLKNLIFLATFTLFSAYTTAQDVDFINEHRAIQDSFHKILESNASEKYKLDFASGTILGNYYLNAVSMSDYCRHNFDVDIGLYVKTYNERNSSIVSNAASNIKESYKSLSPNFDLNKWMESLSKSPSLKKSLESGILRASKELGLDPKKFCIALSNNQATVDALVYGNAIDVLNPEVYNYVKSHTAAKREAAK